jgi:hypothetical protein
VPLCFVSDVIRYGKRDEVLSDCPASAFRNSERHRSGAIQSASLAKVFSASGEYELGIQR